MKYLLAIFLIIFIDHAQACRPYIEGFKQSLEQSNEIYFGVVTGLRDLSLEQGLESSSEDENVVIALSNMEMKVFIKDVVLGKNEDKYINTSGAFCGHGNEIGEEVYVFISSDRNKPFTVTEESLKDIHPDFFKQIIGSNK